MPSNSRNSRMSIAGFLGDIIDDTRGLVDDLVDRARDLEEDVRGAASDAVEGEKDRGGTATSSSAELADLRATLADLTAKVAALAEQQKSAPK